MGASVVEMLLRLSLALVLSLGLAILFAWGWDRSEPPAPSIAPVLAASPLIPAR